MAENNLLVSKLAHVLSEINPAEIDNYIFTAQSSIDRRASLEKTFEYQIQSLEYHGVGENIIHLLVNQKEKVIERAYDSKVTSGNIPFLPVLPCGYRSIYDQIASIKFGNRPGYCYLKNESIHHHYQVPQEPYYIFDVDPGERFLDCAPIKTRTVIENHGRSALTIEEALSLAFHNNILEHYAIDAAGSYVDNPERIPHLYPTISRAGLGWCYNAGHKEWGIPNCSTREVMRNE